MCNTSWLQCLISCIHVVLSIEALHLFSYTMYPALIAISQFWNGKIISFSLTCSILLSSAFRMTGDQGWKISLSLSYTLPLLLSLERSLSALSPCTLSLSLSLSLSLFGSLFLPSLILPPSPSSNPPQNINQELILHIYTSLVSLSHTLSFSISYSLSLSLPL